MTKQIEEGKESEEVMYLMKESEKKMNIACELAISQFKQKKTVAKSAITKCKNKLIELQEEELPSRHKIRELTDKLCALQGNAIQIMMKLINIYKDIEDFDRLKKTSDEIDEIEKVVDMAVEKAHTYLQNTLDSSDKATVVSGIAKLYESGSVKQEQN